MANVTAAMVKELREMTGAGMMECKKALVEADGDIQAAVDVLRKRGLAAAAKKAGRATNEGVIVTKVSADGKCAAAVEVNCETDFVARTDNFIAFANKIAQAVLENDPADVEALKACEVEGETVDAALIEAIHTIGENMNISRFVRVSAEDGCIADYVHMGGKIGVLVAFKLSDDAIAAKDEFKTFANDVALQVCAMRPVAVSRNSVAPEIVAHEMEIYKAQAAESGKPEAIQEKIATGRMEKYYKEFCLLEQAFFKDDSMTVDKLRAKVAKDCGGEIEVVSFSRIELGETAE
ncbi:MAG: elongation factor Ts [Coriobacteriales bacterium]|nr:elongation factor Ts [Coriobacteriales bacterium]